MKNVLLIFDESKVMDFIYDNLTENGYIVYKTSNLIEGTSIAEKLTLDLIVLDAIEKENKWSEFINKIKHDKHKHTTVLKLVELENYIKLKEENNHIVINPIRPKVLLSLIRSVLNKEEANWLPAYH